MTREQYEMAVKEVIEATNKALERCTSVQVAINIVSAQNMRIKAITDMYMKNAK